MVDVAYNYITVIVGIIEYIVYFIGMEIYNYWDIWEYAWINPFPTIILFTWICFFPSIWILVALRNFVFAKNPFWNLFYGINLILAGAVSFYEGGIVYNDSESLYIISLFAKIAVIVTGVLAAISFIASLVRYYREKK